MKIKIKDLLNFNLPKIEIDLWTFSHLLEEWNINYYDINQDKFDTLKFKGFILYDNSSDSDEQSYRYLIYFEDKPCCVIGYTGDRGTFYSYFFSQEIALSLNNYFLSIINDDNKLFELIEDDIDLSDSYTKLIVINGELYNYITSPKWTFINTKKPMFRLEDDETLTPIKFIKFKSDKPSWQEKEEDSFMIVECKGEEVEVPYHRILFKQSL